MSSVNKDLISSFPVCIRFISFFFFFGFTLAAAAKSLQWCLTLCDPIDSSHQAPPSLGFSRREYWSGLPFPSLVVQWLGTDTFTAVMQVQYPIREWKLHKPFGATKEKSGGNRRVAGRKDMDLRYGPTYKGTTRWTSVNITRECSETRRKQSYQFWVCNSQRWKG